MVLGTYAFVKAGAWTFVESVKEFYEGLKTC
jgi:hypothetical protein